MKTIHPAGLATLVSRHKPFDLIDVRPSEQFGQSHIPGARSAPLGKLSGPKTLRERKCAASEPLFVISEDRAMAGLAAGILRGAGCDLPVVVDGGMRVWETQGFPTVHPWRFHF